ncbi:MAG: hypothetical protein L6R48_23975 [Planctomycetes bacterium]|nr:hypothetical protein [Planctomycetota bacterium]
MSEPTDVPAIDPAGNRNTIDQSELDQLLQITGFLNDQVGPNQKSLVEEIEDAVLDSGKLSYAEWIALRDRLKAIERLIPHIDLIIALKAQRRRTTSDRQRSGDKPDK